jgi:hypothetical protein
VTGDSEHTYVCTSCGSKVNRKYKSCLACGKSLREVIPPSQALVPRPKQKSHDAGQVIQAEVVGVYRNRASVLGCTRCSTIYWSAGSEICSECGAAPLEDLDWLLDQREESLAEELPAAMANLGEPLTARRFRFYSWIRRHRGLLIFLLVLCAVSIWMGVELMNMAGTANPTDPTSTDPGTDYGLAAFFLGIGILGAIAILVMFMASSSKRFKQQSGIQTLFFRTLYGGIAAGPVAWYMSEQHDAIGRYGRRLTPQEASDRINALCRQQREAAEAQWRANQAAAAAVAFIVISNQLRNIEMNQRRSSS